MIVKFDEIASFVAGQSPESKYYSDSDGIPFLQGNRTFGTFFPSIDTYTQKATKMAHEGEILMSVRAPVGDLNFAPCDLCIGRGLSAIKAKDGDNTFLFYALKYNIKTLLNQSGGTTYEAVTGDDIRSMDMVIPDDIESHSRISSILHCIDEKIDNNISIIANLESATKLLYDYWFMQFDFPDDNGHPYKSSGGEMTYNEILEREIPKGWNVKRIDELCDVKTGKEDANFSTPNGAYKFFTCSDEPLQCDTPSFSGKSILIAGNGNFNVKHYDGDFNAYQRTYVLQPNDEYYGIAFIEAKNKTELFTKGSNGSIVKFITKGDVGSIYILTSPKATELYETFNIALEKIDIIQSENEKLTSLRDWLLPMLMNGQVKIAD